MMTFYAGVMTGIICGLLIACVIAVAGLHELERRGYDFIKVRGRYKFDDKK